MARNDIVGTHIDGQEVGQEHGGHIENGNQRYAADQLDIADAESPDDGELASPTQRQQDPQGQRSKIADDRQQESQQETAPKSRCNRRRAGINRVPAISRNTTGKYRNQATVAIVAPRGRYIPIRNRPEG
jgi:hypothetical protein